MLINNGLLVNFWAKAMDRTNYFHNRLLIKRDIPTIILEETWTNARQNLKHIHIFGSRVSIFILTEKRSKSDIQKTWRGIFMGYIRTSKHLRVWVSCTH